MQATLLTQDLFPTAGDMPAGFQYSPDLISAAEERELIRWIETLALKPFEFRGFEGKRRVAYFGFRYDYNQHAVQIAPPFPDELLELRKTIAKFSDQRPEDFQQALVTEYAPGTTIGWHRDRPQFGDIVGVSLLSSANFRLRRRDGTHWLRKSKRIAPRSAYILRGEARYAWEHSIPEVDALRYSVTFRTLTNGLKAPPG